MLNIILSIGVTVIIAFLGYKYLEAYEEAKKAGLIYDDKNTEEDN